MTLSHTPNVLSHLRAVAASAWEAGSLRIRSEVGDPAALVPRAREGWICTGGGVYLVLDGQVSPVSGDKTWQPSQVLSAELLLDESHSVHLRRLDHDLRAYHYQEGEGMAVLVRDEVLHSTESDRFIRYRTCWHTQPRTCNGITLDVWQPFLSRFAGWSPR